MATQEHNPPIFFAIAFVILLIGLFTKFAFKSQTAFTPQPKARQSVNSQSEQVVKSLKKLDLNRPVACMFDDNTSTVAAQMEGADIKVDIMPRKGISSHILVVGDCLYRWSEDKSGGGMKKCGIGSAISMGKQFLGSGLLSAEMIEEGMREVGKSMQFDLVEAIDSCKNTASPERNIFALPRGIRFADEALPASK